MEYDKYIELRNITLNDCVELSEKYNKIIVINDGEIVDLEENGGIN